MVGEQPLVVPLFVLIDPAIPLIIFLSQNLYPRQL